MKVSLAVCTYRRAKALQRLLKSLSDLPTLPDQTVVVDSSPDEETAVVVRECKDLPIEYYHVGAEDRGLTRQRNYALKKCTGDIVLFLDDDIIPTAGFFEELRACWERHPEAVGIGGYILGEEWKAIDKKITGLGWYCWEGWVRRESLRWRVRRLFGLASDMPPGWMPLEGHGRPIASYPPDGKDRRVEFVMGGVSSWRLPIAREVKFSTFFEGYGLYEDLDFCLRAGRKGAIFLCTKAQVWHEHDPAGRPRWLRYGRMVVRNGWYVWRLRWPDPGPASVLKWWLITMLLAALRAVGGTAGFVEACGRAWGMVEVILRPPQLMESKK